MMRNVKHVATGAMQQRNGGAQGVAFSGNSKLCRRGQPADPKLQFRHGSTRMLTRILGLDAWTNVDVNRKWHILKLTHQGQHRTGAESDIYECLVLLANIGW